VERKTYAIVHKRERRGSYQKRQTNLKERKLNNKKVEER
jgi:hypothetical protein